MTRRHFGGVVGAALIVFLSFVGPAGKGAAPRQPGRVPLLFNQDASEFFVGTFGPIVPQTLDAYVDSLSGKGVTDLFVNVNYQRTNYRSRVWEADWDGYDPKLGDNQPFFAGIAPERRFELTWIQNAYSLYQQGVDYGERMLARCRRNGLRPWISIRMNDSHYASQPNHPFHSTFWKEHSDWHISPHMSLDYARPEVRAHYLALIGEVLERYDMEGLELDFMRHGYYFRQGQEHEGARLMAHFVGEVRQRTEKSARRRGHPVKLAVRVPTRPWVARSRGLDAVDWARQGWIDLVVASPWWRSTQSDVPVEEWRGLLQRTKTRVAVALEDGIDSGAGGRRTLTVEEARGIALAALHRGADAIYLFNFFTGPYQWDRATYNGFLTDAGFAEALEGRTRRYPLTLIDPWAEGEPGQARFLPFSGERGVFRIPIGPSPRSGQSAEVVLQIEGSKVAPEVACNGVRCSWSHTQGEREHYLIPGQALNEGYNLIEVKTEREAKLTWLEIAVSASPVQASESSKLKTLRKVWNDN